MQSVENKLCRLGSDYGGWYFIEDDSLKDSTIISCGSIIRFSPFYSIKFLATSKANIKKHPNARMNPSVWCSVVVKTMPTTEHRSNKTHLVTINIPFILIFFLSMFYTLFINILHYGINIFPINI